MNKYKAILHNPFEKVEEKKPKKAKKKPVSRKKK
jgi:hypothetical protein